MHVCIYTNEEACACAYSCQRQCRLVRTRVQLCARVRGTNPCIAWRFVFFAERSCSLRSGCGRVRREAGTRLLWLRQLTGCNRFNVQQGWHRTNVLPVIGELHVVNDAVHGGMLVAAVLEHWLPGAVGVIHKLQRCVPISVVRGEAARAPIVRVRSYAGAA